MRFGFFKGGGERASAPGASAEARDGDRGTQAARSSSPATVVNRRLISGPRVLCRFRLELPRLDPFAPRSRQLEGVIALNARGGGLYAHPSLAEADAMRLFPAGQSLRIPSLLLLTAADGDRVEFGPLNVRLLRWRQGVQRDRILLRFIALDERQLDAIALIQTVCPPVSGEEEQAVLRYAAG